MRRSTLFHVLAVACLAVILASPARAGLNRWTTGGPFGGPVEMLEFDPGDPGVVYAGTFGGVYRSEDHGATWTAASFGLAGASVSGLVAASGSLGALYVGTEAGIQKSDDGGRTWQTPILVQSVDALALAPSNPQILYAAVGRSVWRSTNAGANWTSRMVTPVGEGILFVEVDPQAPQTVYAGSQHSLYRSQDGGDTYAPLNRPATNSLVSLTIDPANPQILYAGTSDGVFKSTDRGSTWTRAGQETTGQYVQGVVIDPASSSTLLALGLEVYRSTNAGGSWTSVFDDQNVNHSAAFDPFAASTWLIGTSEGIYRSTDSGASWQPSDTGLTASIIASLAVDPNRPGTLYATFPGPGFLYKSTDAGASWSRVNGLSQVRVVALDPKTPSLVYAATNSGFLRSQNGGATWVLINSTESGINHLVIDPQTPSTLYTSRSQEGIRKSVDGGITWNSIGPDLEDPFTDFLEIAPSAPQTLYTGDSHGVFKTTDGGDTWSALANGGLPHSAAIITLAIDPKDANVLYAALRNERIFKSIDGGTTWSFSGLGIFLQHVEGIAIDPFEPSRLYATNASMGILRSTDAGATWSRFDDGRLPGLWVSQIVLDPVNPHLLYVSSVGGGVLSRAELQPGDSLKLNGNRFRVKMSWATGQGLAGPGLSKPLTGDTGYASFFSESNVEVLLKVLDGCGLNGHFWIFAAGLTNVRTDITVADTQTGAVKIYHSPADQVFQPIQDTSALACGAGTAFAAARESSSVSESVLLRNGRFRVTAEFVTAPGATPLPTQGALLTDDTGYLWFFNQSNVEVLIKVVDGCALNDRFWIFAAGLTNVEMRITVEDTKTGASKVYTNPQGTAFRPVQDTAAFGGCD